MDHSIALIGCGEAARTFAAAADWQGAVRAFDIVESRAAALGRYGIFKSAAAADAVVDATVVLSLVTASEALVAAQSVAQEMCSEALFCDFNSVSPQTKREAAEIIEGTGGRYVDVAVIAPVPSAGMAAPLLLSGPVAREARDVLTSLGFTNIRVVGAEVGRASAIKMIRSVIVKGVEALTDEMMAAANAAGVTDEVLASLDASEQSMPWLERAAYNLERMATHGLRRAAEMEESAKTLRSLGVDPVMTEGTVHRQRLAATKGDARTRA